MRRLLLPSLLVIGCGLFAGCSREPERDPAKDMPMIVPKDGGKAVPAGEVATPQEFAERADVPLYPGAETPDKTSNVRREGNEVRYEIVMITKDMPDKVMSFYKDKLKGGEPVGGNLMGMTPNGKFASVEATRGADKTKVKIVVRASE